MATVRVSFLLGGERFHGRLNRCSVLSDVPAKATRVNRAGPGYKVIRLRRLSHTRQYRTDQAIFLRRPAGVSHFPFAFGPSWRRMASDGESGLSSCFSAHLTIAARVAGSARNPALGVTPVAGRPRTMEAMKRRRRSIL